MGLENKTFFPINQSIKLTVTELVRAKTALAGDTDNEMDRDGNDMGDIEMEIEEVTLKHTVPILRVLMVLLYSSARQINVLFVLSIIFRRAAAVPSLTRASRGKSTSSIALTIIELRSLCRAVLFEPLG